MKVLQIFGRVVGVCGRFLFAGLLLFVNAVVGLIGLIATAICHG